MSIQTSSFKIMKTQPSQQISNKYNTCTVVTSPVYTGSKAKGRLSFFVKAYTCKIGFERTYVGKFTCVAKFTSLVRARD